MAVKQRAGPSYMSFPAISRYISLTLAAAGLISVMSIEKAERLAMPSAKAAPTPSMKAGSV